MTGELSPKEAGLAACLALTAQYFPRKDDEGRVLAPFAAATLFAHRKPHAWAAWAALSPQEQDVVAQVMFLTAPEWADEKRLKAAVLDFVGALSLDDEVSVDRSGGVITLAGGDPYQADAAALRVGGDYLEYAKRVTDRFFTFGKRPRAHAFAGPGEWRTRTAYLGTGTARPAGRSSFPPRAPSGRRQATTFSRAWPRARTRR